MSLQALPRIDRLRLAELVLPEFHPESATDPVSPVFAYVIHQPDGPVLVDLALVGATSSWMRSTGRR